jgi:hypothetical protein
VTDAGFVLAGYVLTFGAIAAYAGRVLLRGRAQAKRVPPEDRRWA